MTRHAYRPDVDGLRAIAILGVVTYHAGLPGISGGFAGVDVFFVISGFLITQLLVQQIARTGRLSLADFYARRIRRLLPALAVVVGVTMILGYFLLSPAGPRQDLIRSALASLAFVANHYFLNTTTGYFSGPAELRPLLHLWSLSVEEQFYLVWPLVLILITRFSPAARRMTWISASIVAISLLSFGYCLSLLESRPAAAFFVAPARAWELGVGAMLALWLPQQAGEALHPRMRRLAALGAALGLLLILFAYVWIEPETRFPGPWALPAVLGAALLIVGNAFHAHSPIVRWLSTPLMTGLGRVSYGWYLWHWPLLAFADALTLMRTPRWMEVLCILLALALAALMLRFIENPIRYGSGPRRSDNRRVLKWGVATLGGMMAFTGAVFAAQSYGPVSPRERLTIQIAADQPEARVERCLIPREDWRGILPLTDCRFGPAQSPYGFVIWGDSHAMAWVPALQEAQARAGLPAFISLTMMSCPPVYDGERREQGRNQENCRRFRRAALEQILQLKSQGLRGVVLAGRWSTLRKVLIAREEERKPHPGLHYFWRQSLRPLLKRSSHAASSVAADPLAEGLSAALTLLQDAGLKVVILLDPPEVQYSVAECAYYYYDHLEECGISRAAYEQAFASTRATIKSVAARFSDVRVFDPVDLLCEPRFCPAFVHGRPILWDNDHLAASTALSFASHVADSVQWLVRP